MVLYMVFYTQINELI